MTALTHKRLKEVLSYNKTTGLFKWKIAINPRAPKGAIAGRNSFTWGYRVINVDNVSYRAARLVWFYVHGKWPDGVVDHINGNRQDDRIRNLRDVSQRTNTQNLRKPMRNNTSGYLGVSWNKGKQKWKAEIRLNGRKTFLGYYATAEEASAVYLSTKRKHHKGCTI